MDAFNFCRKASDVLTVYGMISSIFRGSCLIFVRPTVPFVCIDPFMSERSSVLEKKTITSIRGLFYLQR